MQAALPTISVVVSGHARADFTATLGALAGEAAEVILVQRWPGAGAREALAAAALGAAVVDDATAAAASAANAGVERATGEIVVLLAAGDRPQPRALERHAQALADSAAAAVAGAVVGVDGRTASLAAVWASAWPALAPPLAGRHVAVRRDALLAAGGLDDRLRDLDCAAIDLLARLAESGATVLGQPDIAVRGAPASPFEVGRAARVLDELLAERAAPVIRRASGRRRAALRWARPVLAASGHPLAGAAAFARGHGAPVLPRFPADRVGARQVESGTGRPAVTVIVPFAGSTADAGALIQALAALETKAGDAILVADNSPAPTVQASGRVQVVPAPGPQSSYHGRNIGVDAAATDWLLFLDADCRPCPWLLDAYFDPPPAASDGALVGAVRDDPSLPGVAARFAADAFVIHQPRTLADDYRPWGVTANLLVRRTALERVGGFAASIRSGGDADLCWRLQADGWQIGWRPRAAVLHMHRTTLRGLLSQHRRYGAGVAWLARRHPDSDRRWPERPAQPIRGLLTELIAARGRNAVTSALRLACTAAGTLGGVEGNRPPGERRSARGPALLTGAWPDAAMALPAPPDAHVEAAGRPLRADRAAYAAVASWAYSEDDAPLDHVAALAALRLRALVPALVRGRGRLAELAADAAVARRVAEATSLLPQGGIPVTRIERIARLLR